MTHQPGPLRPEEFVGTPPAGDAHADEVVSDDQAADRTDQPDEQDEEPGERRADEQSEDQ